MKYLELNRFINNELKTFKGIKYVLESMISGKPYLLYFISPEIDVKSAIIKDFMIKHEAEIPSELKMGFKMLSSDFDKSSLLLLEDWKLSDQQLVEVYAYYAKFKSIPQWVLHSLVQYSKEKDINNRFNFLINIFLSNYYLQNNNFDMAEAHIKYCIEYINYNIDKNPYETMIAYVICGRYLEKTLDIFTSPAGNYYKLAEDIALRLEDEISLASILSYLAYYYHNIDERDKSSDYGYKALELARQLDLPSLCFGVNKILSIISFTMGDYDKSSNYMKSAIDAAARLENFSTIENIKLKNTLGYIYSLKGSYEKSLDMHLEALKELALVESASEILDEAVKTFDNLSSSFKMLGSIHTSICFAERTMEIIKNCNYGHRINDIQNLCKSYTDIGLLYGLYLNDRNNAAKYYELAKANISNSDHYIKYGNLKVLEAYVYANTETLDKSKKAFEKAIEVFMGNGSSNVYVQSLLVSYFVSFASFYEDSKEVFLVKAKELSTEFKLYQHFDFAVDFFIQKKSFNKIVIKEENYPINLIMMISEERKHHLRESKKAQDFELIQNFSNRISNILSEKDLYEEAQNLFNKYFLSKGFIVLKHDFVQGFKYSLHLQNEILDLKNDFVSFLEGFIDSHNLVLEAHGKNYDIFNFGTDGTTPVKSMIIYYIYDEINSTNYYFTIFYDKNSSWLFSTEEAEVGLILVKNMFLKLKSIDYMESIKSNSLLDYATGLYNAKFMWNKLDELFILGIEDPESISMALMDLNDFKKINDIYGHYAGDEAIRFFSKILRLVIRKQDYVIRYGGDEFIILFSKLKFAEAESYVKKIKTLCSTQPFVFNDQRIFLDFSYGLGTMDKNFNCGKEFFNYVDKEMYLYKQKNKVKS